LLKENRVEPPQASGIITVPSTRSVKETLDHLETILKEKGVTIFGRVDHSGEASKAGLSMPDTQVLIFGNPRGGTPVMLEAPLSAIDLPLKALAWTDSEGDTWLSYNDPAHFRDRFTLSEGVMKGIATLSSLIPKAAE